MKKVLLVFLCLFVCQFAMAQKGKKKKKEWLEESSVPSAVMDAFKAKYASVEATKWRLSKKGNYKAHYKSGEDKVEVTFSPDGTWKHTRTKLADANIPASVSSYISSNYAGYEVKKVMLPDNSGKGVRYLAHLKKDEEKPKLVFDKDGNFTKVAKAKKGKGKRGGGNDDEDIEE